MRVLHVIPSLAIAHGGPTRALAIMECALSSAGFHVVTISTNDDGPSRRNIKPTGIGISENSVIHLYFSKQTEFYKVSLGLAWWLLRHVKDFDLVHIHALFSFSSVAAVWLARLRGVPYVVRPLGTLTQYGVTQRRPILKRISLALLEGPALRGAAAVHFTSREEQREAELLGVPMRGVVLPLGVEPAEFADSNVIRLAFPELGLDTYLLFLSRLDPKKNLEGLLRGFSEVATQWPQVQLLVAGDGSPEYVSSLRVLSRQLGLEGRVIWAGHIEGNVKASAFAGATVFVLPSFSENFGIAVVEAMAAGLPCLVGHGVAIAEGIERAGAGFAINTTSESIARGIRRYLESPELCVSSGAMARKLAQREYSIERMGEQLIALYGAIVQNEKEVTE